MTPALQALLFGQRNPIIEMDFGGGVYRLGGASYAAPTAVPGFSSVNPLTITPGVGVTIGATDVVSVTGLVFPAAVTLIAFATPNPLNAASTGPATLQQGATGNRITIYRQNGTNQINGFTATTVTNVALSVGLAATAGVEMKQAMTNNGSRVRYTANGAAVTESTNASAIANPTIFDRLEIGHQAATGQFLGTIRRIIVLPYEMMATELRNITAL